MLNHVAKDVLTVRSKTYTHVVYFKQLSDAAYTRKLIQILFFAFFSHFSSSQLFFIFCCLKKIENCVKAFLCHPLQWFHWLFFFGSKRELLKTHFHPIFFYIFRQKNMKNSWKKKKFWKQQKKIYEKLLGAHTSQMGLKIHKTFTLCRSVLKNWIES